MNKLHNPEFPIKKKPGRPKKQPEVKELDRLKNIVGRQDDMIAQLSDEVKRLENLCQGYDEDIVLLEDKIESYREILKTLLEITE
jgi:hypothetical protein